jgi:membrane fusion protein
MANEENNNNTQETKKEIPLFRKEALEHKKVSFLGKATIITPISYSIWTLGLFAIAVTLGLFLYFGKYAKRQEVLGMLVPNKGLIHVHAKGVGVVTNRFVEQGDKVTKGQLLYLISTEQHTLSEQGAVAQTVESLEKQIAVQKNKLAIAARNLARFKQLLDEKVISEVDYQKPYDEYLNTELSLRKTEQELIQAKGSGDYAIRASGDGIISTLIAMVGDQVTQEKPLAVIIPSGAELQGVLFVPTKSIGFVKPGQKVLLKYHAYPYQNFGLYESTVERIDKSILFPKDFDMPMITSADASTPFYRVIVKLKTQTVMVYGKPYPLTSGMTLQGSILGEERNIWQWFLEPIYSLKGSLTSS